MSEISNPKLATSGKEKIAWAKNFMPTLNKIGDALAKQKPFSGLKIGMSVHMEAKTANLALTLKQGGARVYATGCNPLSTQDDVAAGLASLGVEVYAAHDVSESKYRQHLHMVIQNQPDLIIDDGGDLLDAYCKSVGREKWIPIGGCEETTTGIIRLKQRELANALPFPMMNINDACCKHYYDNVFGTGQSVLTAIMDTTNTLIAGKTVVVAGYGHCGSGIAMRARGMGANVIVTEVDPIKAIQANLNGFRVMTMDEAAPLGDYFITATGCKDVITMNHFIKMKDDAFLANAGHFNVEINLDDLADLSYDSGERLNNVTGYTIEGGRTLNVLAEGRLVNLAAGKGHPAEIMDMSFALQALGLKFLVKNRLLLQKKVYELPTNIDRYVAETKLGAMGIKIDRLTEDQHNYLGV